MGAGVGVSTINCSRRKIPWSHIPLHSVRWARQLSCVASTNLIFANTEEHRQWLATQAKLPRGFSVGTTKFNFTPLEAPKPSQMTLTLLKLDQPTADFGAVFTRNAFPGAPILIGRERLGSSTLGALLINNKVSNVCAPGGVASAEAVCTALGASLGLQANQVFPSSTGVIGWRIPHTEMIAALPSTVDSLQADSILPAAQGIMTTDLYPKIRSIEIGGGRIVGIVKGAGMIEPNLATMLGFLVTDLAVPRETLRELLTDAVRTSFNQISIDSDTSTSDTVALISSGAGRDFGLDDFAAGLRQVCRDLAEDVVRNGEGVRHVIRVDLRGAPNDAFATRLGRAIVNAPLFKCAIAGNDPNVGRLVQAIGRHLGHQEPEFDASPLRLTIGGIEIFADGVFHLDPTKEAALTAHLQSAELYASSPTAQGVFTPPIDFPRHERSVEIGVSLGSGVGTATVLGGDLTHEYVTENADYRS
jgi:glutamate N-acetyltransferase / amino-acid N-acetyltransferase